MHAPAFWYSVRPWPHVRFPELTLSGAAMGIPKAHGLERFMGLLLVSQSSVRGEAPSHAQARSPLDGKDVFSPSCVGSTPARVAEHCNLTLILKHGGDVDEQRACVSHDRDTQARNGMLQVLSHSSYRCHFVHHCIMSFYASTGQVFF